MVKINCNVITFTFFFYSIGPLVRFKSNSRNLANAKTFLFKRYLNRNLKDINFFYESLTPFNESLKPFITFEPFTAYISLEHYYKKKKILAELPNNIIK